MENSDRIVDQQYLQSLEKKLKNLKNPQKLTAKTFLSDIASYKDHQLFKLMSEPGNETKTGFEDNFVVDAPITPNFFQRKIAPQTCAINKQELVKLLKADFSQLFHEEVDDEDFLTELRELAAELANRDIDEIGSEETETKEEPK